MNESIQNIGITLLIKKSLLIGLIASSIVFFLSCLIMVFDIQIHITFLIFRYLLLGVAITYMMKRLKQYVPEDQIINYGLLSGLLVSMTMALGALISNVFYLFIDDSFFIMDRVMTIDCKVRFLIIEVDLMMNTLVIGFLISAAFCGKFIKEM